MQYIAGRSRITAGPFFTGQTALMLKNFSLLRAEIRFEWHLLAQQVQRWVHGVRGGVVARIEASGLDALFKVLCLGLSGDFGSEEGGALGEVFALLLRNSGPGGVEGYHVCSSTCVGAKGYHRKHDVVLMRG